jgi:diguanylate cyclase (GGDEF)-like protein
MLTTLWNRRQGLEFLQQAFAAFKRYRHVLSVAMVDIDHFKRINDTYGHQCGDQALRHVANILRKACRKADAVARWGGEEFLLILPSTGSAGARVAAERFRMRLNGQPVRFDTGSECSITVSAGVAQCDDQGYDAALNRADKALYLAKSRGRNRVELG